MLPERIPSPHGGRPPIDDRLVFEKLLLITKTGISYDDAADSRCSATTIRNRRDAWADAGYLRRLRVIAVENYDWAIGIDFDDLSADGCITKAPCGG